MNIDLDAIRQRDRDAEACGRCGLTRNGHVETTLDECNRLLALGAKHHRKPVRTCGDPGAHHDFESVGRYEEWDGSADRHVLLLYIDTLTGGAS